MTIEEILDGMRITDRDLFAAEDKLRLLNDRLNMTVMRVRADVSGLSEPQVWLAIWQDSEYISLYQRINDTRMCIVDLRAQFEDLHHRFTYTTAVANATAIANVVEGLLVIPKK